MSPEMKRPMRVRISKAVISHISGGDAWQSGQQAVEAGYERQSTVDMTEAIKAAQPRKDGSVVIEIDADQADTLYRMADVMAIGARDNVGVYTEALGDLNAARALMRQLAKDERFVP